MKKFEKEFRAEHPETVGETDKQFDDCNYMEWLEEKLVKLFAIPVVSNSVCEFCGTEHLLNPKIICEPCLNGMYAD